MNRKYELNETMLNEVNGGFLLPMPANPFKKKEECGGASGSF